MNSQISVQIYRTSVSAPGRSGRAAGMAGMVTLGLVLLAIPGEPARAAAVPNPNVTGPVPAKAEAGDPSHDYPFFCTTVDLASQGYVEEEFFFEGTANRYNTPAGATGSIIDSGHPYRTRMMVRRPASPENFNGTVLMEWQNVTGNYDLDGLWIASYDHFIRRGYAWIGVSAQAAGIHDPATGLKVWSPSRYGTLDVTVNGRIPDNALAYDIFSQAAQAVRHPSGIDPMGGLPVKRVFAIGVSQSANRLLIYHNSIHPLASIFDAFFLVGMSVPNILRTDLDVKVFKLVTETDLAMLGQAANRQPDSDRFRKWEGAGIAHMDYHEAQGLAPVQARDFGPSAPATPACELPPFSRIPGQFSLNAAYDHLVRWVKDNIQPPRAPEMEVVAAGPPVVIARDPYGNALGGVRLPQHAVATATNTGVNSGPGACRNYGSFQPFDDASLARLYPDHMTYVIRVMEATLENLTSGFMVPEDAAATVLDAAYSDIGAYPEGRSER